MAQASEHEQDLQDLSDLLTVIGMGEDEPSDNPLEGLDRHDVQDLEDGCGRWSGQAVPHEQRFWTRQGALLDSRRFNAMFRCMKKTFVALVLDLYGTMEMTTEQGGGRGRQFDPSERVAIFLYRVGGGVGVRQVATQFEVSEGSVYEITMLVAQRVVNRLLPRYVKWPEPDEQEYISAVWELEKRLRKVIGAIDGSHIRIPAPKVELQSQYYNYKGFYSIVLLAVCDNRGMFRWFASGAPGSSGDSGILQKCPFYRKILAEQQRPMEERSIFANGACILGDSAFAESPWLRTPFTAPSTRPERFFNWAHSSQRFRIEHAYGRLKWKFPCLRTGLLFKLDHAPIIIDACVTLYNYILAHEGDTDGYIFVDPDQTRNGTGRSASGAAAGASSGQQSARHEEMEYLEANGFIEAEWGAPGSRADAARRQVEQALFGQGAGGV